MSKPLTLLILAAGLGSRFGGFKQIAPVGPNGEVILDYSIFDAIRAGFDRVVMVIRPELETPLREHFEQFLNPSVKVDFVFQRMDDLPDGFTLPPERVKPWGTCHAILAARDVIDGPFGVINADDFYGAHSYEVLAENLRNLPENSACLVGFELMKTLSPNGSVSRGLCQIDSDGNLLEVIELTKIEHDGKGGAKSLNAAGEYDALDRNSIVSMNMWGFGPEAMGEFWRLFAEFLKESISQPKAEFYIPIAVDSLVKTGKGTCLVRSSTSQWFGITYPEDKQETVDSIQRLVNEGKYPLSLK
ncbi:MAG TPA: NTP transferase domain-containing protein [Chthoniobacterales bacterium]